MEIHGWLRITQALSANTDSRALGDPDPTGGGGRGWVPGSL